MNQICICSDIQSEHLSLSKEDLLDLKNLNLDLLKEDIPLLQLRDSHLEVLRNEIECLLDVLFLNRKQTAKINTSVRYKGIDYGLDFRDSYDFKICVIANLHDIVDPCIQMSGTLFVYNSDLLRRFNGDSIVAFLRVKGSLRKEAIKMGINEKMKVLPISQAVDDELLEKGLTHLLKYGLIDYNKKEEKYGLTARGYVFW